MKWIEKDLEIRYADTDQMGVVHHAIHPVYSEICRIHMCQEAGFPYHQIEREGFLFMVVDIAFRYLAPIRYGEAIYVRGAFSHLNRRMMTFQYEIRNKDTNKLLCTGMSKHVVTSPEGRPTRLPPHIFAGMHGFSGL